MLSPADADLAKRDAALPGLSRLLDTDAFADALAEEPGFDAIDSVGLTYLRYKPATNCIAAYRVETASGPFSVYAKLHGEEDARKLRKLSEPDEAGGPARQKRISWRDLATVVFQFPDDAKLTALSRIENPDATRKLMSRVFWRPREISDTTLSTLGYKPERRYVGFMPGGASPPTVLKFYAPPGFRVAKAGRKDLGSRGPLRLAKQLGSSDRHNVLAFEWLEGRLLRSELESGDGGLATVARVGEALALLHVQKGHKLPIRRGEDETTKRAELARTLSFLVPGLEQRAVSLVSEIERRMALGDVRRAPCHGDFYDKQVLIDGDRVALLDLDGAAIGNPLSDLGLFLAHLERDRILGREARQGVDAMTAAFLQGYQQATGGRLRGVEAHIADGLLRLAHYPFRTHEPNWPELTERIVARATEILER